MKRKEGVRKRRGSGAKIKAFSFRQPRDVNPVYMKFWRLFYGRAPSKHVVRSNLRSVRAASQTAGRSLICGPDPLPLSSFRSAPSQSSSGASSSTSSAVPCPTPTSPPSCGTRHGWSTANPPCCVARPLSRLVARRMSGRAPWGSPERNASAGPRGERRTGPGRRNSAAPTTSEATRGHSGARDTERATGTPGSRQGEWGHDPR